MAENPRIEELRRRVQADPASIAFAALAEEFRRVGRNADAIDTCRTGLQRHPAYLSARVTLGRALIETGDYEGAREELETVLRSAPENLAAIRGLATINERLGHSTEMDPHIADVMKTMHAESIRVAALKPPPPPEPVYVPQPIVVEAAPVEPEPQFQEEPEFEATPQVEPEPQFEAQPEPEAPAQPQAYVEVNPPGDAPSRTEPELDLSLAPPLGGTLAPDPDLALMLEAEPEVDTAAGPDPEMLATLARLERFLGSIQSLRA